MGAVKKALYWLRLAEGSLTEARQDLDWQRCRTCVSSSPPTAENAAQAMPGLA